MTVLMFFANLVKDFSFEAVDEDDDRRDLSHEDEGIGAMTTEPEGGLTIGPKQFQARIRVLLAAE